METDRTALTRRAIDAFNRRDLQAMLETVHPEGEWFSFRAQLEGEPYRGHAGMRRFFEDLTEDWDHFALEVEEIVERGDTVLTVARVRARGRGSGVEVDSTAGFVGEVRDLKLIRLQSFSDPDAARVAAGLGAQP